MDQPRIDSIAHRCGMVATAREADALQAATFTGPSLTPEVVAAIMENDLLALGGEYGIEDAGHPVEVDDLVIQHSGGVTRIRVYNRAIMLFTTDDEVIRRIHRACCVLLRAAGRWPP